LLENAGKWSPEGETVEVRLAGGELSVRDHGPGIAPEDRPLVFDRFFRSSSARSMPGSGLGLAIVREVADAHDGDVSAEEAPGGGALVRLRLNGARNGSAPGSASS
ncbi:MAG TPA: sensor histidine kinase, partial [Gaiellaceae bacterium]|nr:sensor histidine kinase [Gaiellaceae bacterium]